MAISTPRSIGISGRGNAGRRALGQFAIIQGNYNIDPKVIEEALCHHPEVVLAAAVGKPDAIKRELPVAYVELQLGSEVDPATLLDHCRNTVPERAACPIAIEIIDKMPQTAVGKISSPHCADTVSGGWRSRWSPPPSRIISYLP